jgi:hypothetical protein
MEEERERKLDKKRGKYMDNMGEHNQLIVSLLSFSTILLLTPIWNRRERIEREGDRLRWERMRLTVSINIRMN